MKTISRTFARTLLTVIALVSMATLPLIMTGCGKSYAVIDATETVTISKGELDNLVTDRKLLIQAVEDLQQDLDDCRRR